RSYGDWSSDVCSSDLIPVLPSLQKTFLYLEQVFVIDLFHQTDRLQRVERGISQSSSCTKFGGDPTFLAKRILLSCLGTCLSLIRSEERRVGKEGRSRW